MTSTPYLSYKEIEVGKETRAKAPPFVAVRKDCERLKLLQFCIEKKKSFHQKPAEAGTMLIHK